MRVSEEPYEGSLEEESGYYESPGKVIVFAETDREYRFRVEDSMPQYAVSLPSMFDGRRVTLMIHAPHAASSPAIAVPKSCPLLREALTELASRGVRYVSFFNQVSGGYTQLRVEEVAGA